MLQQFTEIIYKGVNQLEHDRLELRTTINYSASQQWYIMSNLILLALITYHIYNYNIGDKLR